MKSWGSEFGYELINEDWQLKYPPPDPNLAKVGQPGRRSGPQEHCPLDRRRAEQVWQAAAQRQLIVRRQVMTSGRAEAGEAESPGFYSLQAGRPLCRIVCRRRIVRDWRQWSGRGSGGGSAGSGGGIGQWTSECWRL